MFSPLVDQLIEHLRCLPGVGTKTAQRMAFYLLERNRHEAKQLALTLSRAMDSVQHCSQCRTFSETLTCEFCKNPKRNQALLCIVETPADVLAIEQTGGFKGLYFVLMGHLSPLDGIGPDEIGIGLLQRRLTEENFSEVILATNPTVEGEATAHYLAELIKPHQIKASRLAHGVPLGGELEYIDSRTLAHALAVREVLHS